MESISTFFKEEEDYFYRKGEAKRSRTVIENLIIKLGFSDLQAAEIAEVDVQYVAKIRSELKK